MCNVNNSILCKYVNRIRLNLIQFGYAKVGTEWKGIILPPVCSRLYYIVDGVSFITTADTRMMLSPGKWYLIPAGCSFEYECTEHMEHVYFHLKLCDFDETDLLRNCLRPLFFDSPEDKSEFLIHCLKSDAIVDGLLLRQAIYDVLLSIMEINGVTIKSKDYSPCIFGALQYIKQNLSVQLTLSEIAENVFVSKSTLTKHFQNELSMSVREYIYDTIMFEAGQLLLNSNLSTLAISEKFGFSDQFYFSKRFKAKFGESPREYKKSNIF